MARTTDGRALPETVLDGPNGGQGLTPFTIVSAANNNLTLVKATPTASLGQPAGAGVRLFKVNAFTATSTAYLKVFNAASTGAVTMGTTAPVLNIALPVGASPNFDFGDIGVNLSAGCVIAITGGQALLDNTAVAAGQVSLNLAVD